MSNIIEPLPHQAKVIAERNVGGAFLGGSRGGGKSYTLVLDCICHVVERGKDARPIIVHNTLIGLSALFDAIYSNLVLALGTRVSRNKADMTIYTPNGAILYFTQIDEESYAAKIQGRSFSALYADEVGGYSPAQFRALAKIRSGLRTTDGRTIRIMYCANPFGASHSLCVKHHWSKAAPGHPYRDDSGYVWINYASNYRQNTYLPTKAYGAQIKASTLGDQNLWRAWDQGDWSVLGGCMFDNYDPLVHTVPIPDHHTLLHAFKWKAGADWGLSSPSACVLVGQAQRQLDHMRYGSLLVLAETDTATPDDLAVGLGHSPQAFASQISSLFAEFGLKPTTPVIADNFKNADSTTVVELYRLAGLNADPVTRKDRVGGWARIRQRLEHAKTGDGPGLYFSGRVPHLIETLQESPRNPNKVDDLDPKWNRDHWCDSLSYAVASFDDRANHSGSGRVVGLY